MTNLSGKEKSQYVQGVFTRIAARYDLMNRLMTAGQDVRWRNEVIQRAGLHAGDCMLDLGAGTGDLARTAMRTYPGTHITAADFTFEMMRAGRKPQDVFTWANADALELPFPDESFHAVVSGYLMRNVVDRPAALLEQYRVLKPGGRLVILDTTRPKPNLLSPFIWLHMHVVIPLMGTLLSGQNDAYTYLPDSTEEFLTAEDLAEYMKAAGFRSVGYKRLMFGTIAIHWALK